MNEDQAPALQGYTGDITGGTVDYSAMASYARGDKPGPGPARLAEEAVHSRVAAMTGRWRVEEERQEALEYLNASADWAQAAHREEMSAATELRCATANGYPGEIARAQAQVRAACAGYRASVAEGYEEAARLQMTGAGPSLQSAPEAGS